MDLNLIGFCKIINMECWKLSVSRDKLLKLLRNSHLSDMKIVW